jgi:hypothetical protein
MSGTSASPVCRWRTGGRNRGSGDRWAASSPPRRARRVTRRAGRADDECGRERSGRRSPCVACAPPTPLSTRGAGRLRRGGLLQELRRPLRPEAAHQHSGTVASDPRRVWTPLVTDAASPPIRWLQSRSRHLAVTFRHTVGDRSEADRQRPEVESVEALAIGTGQPSQFVHPESELLAHGMRYLAAMGASNTSLPAGTGVCRVNSVLRRIWLLGGRAWCRPAMCWAAAPAGSSPSGPR